MKTATIIQPGRVGDIIICLPIAHYYHKMGYQVKWPVPKNYYSIFDNIEYVNPISLHCDIMDSLPKAYSHINPDDLVIDLSIGFPGSRVSKYLLDTKYAADFIDCKYKLANVSYDLRRTLSFTRNTEKENALYENIVGDLKNYTLFHTESSSGNINVFDVKSVENPIFINNVEGYTIFDWSKIIEKCQAIYCIDSSVCNLLEGSTIFTEKKKYYSDKRPNHPWVKNMPNSLKNGWTFV